MEATEARGRLKLSNYLDNFSDLVQGKLFSRWHLRRDQRVHFGLCMGYFVSSKIQQNEVAWICVELEKVWRQVTSCLMIHEIIIIISIFFI